MPDYPTNVSDRLANQNEVTVCERTDVRSAVPDEPANELAVSDDSKRYQCPRKKVKKTPGHDCIENGEERAKRWKVQRETCLQLQQQQQQQQTDLENDVLYQFFVSMYNYTKVLPMKQQRQVRLELFAIVSQAEVDAERVKSMGNSILSSSSLTPVTTPSESRGLEVMKDLCTAGNTLSASESLANAPVVAPKGQGKKHADGVSSGGSGMFTESNRFKFRLRGGTAVDPDSGLKEIAHVYQTDKDVYTAVLGFKDIKSCKNSYYKLQLLAAIEGNRYWCFRSWGRLDTALGGKRVSEGSLYEMLEEFKGFYQEKSGNMWENRHNFVEVPGKMYPVDFDGNEEAVKVPDNSISLSDSNSNDVGRL